MRKDTGRKIQKVVCGLGVAIDGLMTLGICDGMSRGVVDYNLGLFLMLGGVMVLIILLWGAGALEGRR